MRTARKFLWLTIAAFIVCAQASAYDPLQSQIKTKTTNFNGALSTADTDGQKAFDTLDNLFNMTGSNVAPGTNGDCYQVFSSNGLQSLTICHNGSTANYTSTIGGHTFNGTTSQLNLGNGYTINGDNATNLKIGSTGFESYCIDAEGTSNQITISDCASSGVATYLYSGIGLEVNSTSTTSQLTLKTTNTLSSNEAVLRIMKDPTTAANGDQLGMIDFYGEDSAANVQRYGYIFMTAPTVTSGAEDGRMDFAGFVGGSLRTHLIMDQNGLTVSSSDLLSTGAITASALVTANLGLKTTQGATGAGFLDFNEDTDDGSNKTRVIAQPMASDITLTLPAAQGGASTFLQNDGSGSLSWASVSGAPGGSTTQIQRNNAGAFGAVTGCTSAGTNITCTAGNLLATSPVFTTDITSPLVIGGTTTTSDLDFKTTSGVGTTGADMHFKVGNNGATEAMTILNSGFVGIGNATPLGGLDFANGSGAAGWAYLRGNVASTNPSTSVNSGLSVGWNASAGEGETQLLYGTGAGSTPRLDFGSWSGSAKAIQMTLKAAGLGIGTNNPGYALHVVVGSAGNIKIDGDTRDSYISAPFSNLMLSQNSYYSSGFKYDATGAASQISFGSGGAIGLSTAPSGTAGNAVTFTERLSILNTGNVGINTTAPDGALEVNMGTAGTFRLSYNDNNGSAATYQDTTISSAGIVDFNAVGSGAAYTFQDPVRVIPPTAQTIADTNTVAADACSSIKQITSAGAVVTSTSATFTAPAATNAGCVMHVCNVGSNNITLDNNTDFKSAGGADVVMTADDCVVVGSTGASGKWYQISALEAN